MQTLIISIEFGLPAFVQNSSIMDTVMFLVIKIRTIENLLVYLIENEFFHVLTIVLVRILVLKPPLMKGILDFEDRMEYKELDNKTIIMNKSFVSKKLKPR